MMRWREIADLYRKACGGSDDAWDERYAHLNDAYRRVCATMELPELHVPNAEVQTPPAADSFLVDASVFSIDTIVDKETGTKLSREPEGFRGRTQFYERGQSRPPYGIPRFWVNRGNRVWLRDTPEEVRTLLITFRANAPQIGDADLDDLPLTPPQFDMAIVKMAAASYFSLHPPQTSDGLDYQRAPTLAAEAEGMLMGPKDPVAEEDLDTHRKWVRQRGYDFSISGR